VKRFPFTADPPNKPGEGKIRTDGIIAHLTVKYLGNVHDNGAVERAAGTLGMPPTSETKIRGSALKTNRGNGFAGTSRR
jgi:hypothetical protein